MRAKMDHMEGQNLLFAPWNTPIKSENQTVLRCKQPIKIEKPLQCLLTFCYSFGEKHILQTIWLSIFFSFYFLSALQSDNNNTVYVLEPKHSLGRLRAHFNPRLTAWAKMSRAQNIFMPLNIKSMIYVTYIWSTIKSMVIHENSCTTII